MLWSALEECDRQVAGSVNTDSNIKNKPKDNKPKTKSKKRGKLTKVKILKGQRLMDMFVIKVEERGPENIEIESDDGEELLLCEAELEKQFTNFIACTEKLQQYGSVKEVRSKDPIGMEAFPSSLVSCVVTNQFELTSVWDDNYSKNIQFSAQQTNNNILCTSSNIKRDDDVRVVQYEGGGQVCVSDIYTSSRSSMENISENSMTGGAGRQSECGSSRIQPRQGDVCGQVASLSQLHSRHEKQMEARSRTPLWLRWERRVTKTIFQRGGEARKFLSAVRILHSVRHCQQA